MTIGVRTPSAITAAARKLAASLGADAPRFVFVLDDPDGSFGFSWQDVYRKVLAAGGSAVWGYAIWEMPGNYLWVEPRPVWSDPRGTLLDIAPRTDDGSRVLFAPHAAYGTPFDRLVSEGTVSLATDRPTRAQVNSPLFDGRLLEEELAVLTLRQVAEKYGLDLDRLRYVVEVASKHEFARRTEEHHAIYRRALKES